MPVRGIREIVRDEAHLNENILAIERFEAEAGPYEAQQKYVMAAECYEQAINLRRKYLGDADPDFLSAIERYVVCCNIWGMRYLNSGKYTSSLELLKKADVMTEADNAPNFQRRVSLRAATFSNLCCYFRHRGKLNAALQFAEKALKIEQRYKDAENPARTHLNYAVLLSTLNRHEESIEHIESAIAILHDEERQISHAHADGDDSAVRAASPPPPGAGRWPSVEDGKPAQHRLQEAVAALVVAYHNMWVELTRLSRREAALESIVRAANISRRQLGSQHFLTGKIEETLAAVQEQLSKAPSAHHALEVAAHEQAHGGDLGHGPQAMSAGASRTGLSAAASAAAALTNYAAGVPVAHGQLPPVEVRTPREARLQWQAFGELKGDGRLHMPDAPRITLRYRMTDMGLLADSHRKGPPPVPPGFSSPRKADEKEHAWKPETLVEQIYGAQHLFGSRGHWGSPVLQQLAHGTEPKIHDGRLLREGNLSPEVTQTPGIRPLASEVNKPPAEAPFSPHLKAAYDYHMRQVQMRENCDAKDSDVPLELDRLHAISVFRSQLAQRRERGLPASTDNNRIMAATKIQALFRGFSVRQWNQQELARDFRRRARLEELAASGFGGRVMVTAMHQPRSEGGDGHVQPAPPSGPPDMKRRVAFRVIHAAKRAIVMYSAAVRLQKAYRGWVARKDIQQEIARVANETATKLQALYRRYSAVLLLGRRDCAAVQIQSAWRRKWSRRVAGDRRDAARLITRIAFGFTTRKRQRALHSAAVPLQCMARNFLVQRRSMYQGRGALAFQRTFRGWTCRKQQRVLRLSATKIEALWRGHATRMQLTRRHRAAQIIQQQWRTRRVAHLVHVAEPRRMQWAAAIIGASWRGHRLRKTRPYRRAACKLQARMRGILTRRRVKGMPRAAVSIQAVWRAHRARFFVKAKLAMVLAVQKHWRRHLINTRLRRLTWATTLCQQLVRSNVGRRRLRKMQASAKALQSCWRSGATRHRVISKALAAQRIQRALRAHVESKRQEQRKRAADRIRAGWVSHMARRQVTGKLAAVAHINRRIRTLVRQIRQQRADRVAGTLQRYWRGYLARRTLRRRIAAATQVQAAFRSRVQQDKYFLLRNVATIRIQRAWRRIRWTRTHRHRRDAATLLQKRCRGWVARRLVSEHVEAVVDIQCAWRSNCARFRVRRASRRASQLGSFVRAVLQRCEMRRQREAATRIQSIHDGLRWRHTDTHRSAVVILTAWLKGRLWRLRYLRKRTAAIVIQKCCRARQARQLFNKKKEMAEDAIGGSRATLTILEQQKREADATLIQRWWRGLRSRWQVAKKREAAVYIQRVTRGAMCRTRLRERDLAACHIQACWHGRKQWRRYQRLRKAQRVLAGVVRARRARRYFHIRFRRVGLMLTSKARELLHRRRINRSTAAAIIIQRHLRGYLARCRVRFLRDKGPVKIQNYWRMIKARKYVEQLRLRANAEEVRGKMLREQRGEQRRYQAATRIQACQRMRRTRRQYRRIIDEALPRIVALNRMFHDRDDYKTMVEAVHVIQRAVRVRQVNIMKRHRAAFVIQCSWRRHLITGSPARLKFNDALALHAAATVIQARWRYHSRRWHHLRCLVATHRIQAAIRGHQARRRRRRMKQAAMRLQVSMALIWLAKRKVRKRYQCAIKLQAFARRVVARARLRRRTKATLLLQSAWRAELSRRHEVERQNNAACRIQANLRMCFQRGVALPRRQAAIAAIQAHARGYLQRKRIRIQTAAACQIQRKVRLRRFRYRLYTIRWLALTLQRLFRGRRSRAKTALYVYGILHIKAITCGSRLRCDIMPMHIEAATTIQRVVRGVQTRRAHQRRHRAATLLQAHWRRHVAQQRHRVCVGAAMVIQRQIQRSLHRRRMRAVQNTYSICAGTFAAQMQVESREEAAKSTRLLQRVERGRQARARVAKMQDAATTLQRFSRGLLARKTAAKRRQAVYRLQAHLSARYRKKVFAERICLVIFLQASIKAWFGRRHFKELRRCQLLISRRYRGRVVQRRYAAMRAAALLISKELRRWSCEALYSRQVEAAKIIQGAWRARLERDEVQERTDAAAVIIAWWRMRLQKARHTQVRLAGVRITGAVRAWRQMRARRRRQEAATHIASMWRSYKARAELGQAHTSAAKIQRWWRDLVVCRETADMAVWMLVQIKLLNEERHSRVAHIVQRAFRRHRHRREHLSTSLRPNAIRIQKFLRMKLAQRQVRSMRAFRGTNVQTYFGRDMALMPGRDGRLTQAVELPEVEPVDSTQAGKVVRVLDLKSMSTKQRGEFSLFVDPIRSLAKWLYYLRCIGTIQRFMRGFLVRRLAKRRHAASTRIQASWRAFSMARTFATKRRAAVTIQAHVRGFLQRKHVRAVVLQLDRQTGLHGTATTLA